MNYTENKLSSTRSLHAEVGVGVVRVNVHVYMLCIPELPGTRLVAMKAEINCVMVVLSSKNNSVCMLASYLEISWKMRVVKFYYLYCGTLRL